jgi:endogenous inhibitor of DNA gyrase (YacG/DUF329 family)
MTTGMTSCAHCATPMPTPTGRQARKRYCSQRCRKAAWRARHHGDTARNVVSNTVPDPVPTPSRDDVATPGAGHQCPHCRQPLAIISVVVPASAATVHVPEVTATPNPPLR